MKPETSPLLSICVPTFNRASFLSECLDAIVAQLDKSARLQSIVEIIVSDNGSTDDTASVMAKYASLLPKAKMMRHRTNLGLDRNVNGCIRSATGQYVWIFSDDDIMSYGAIECVVDVLCTHPDVGMIHLNSYGFRGPLTPLLIDKSVVTEKHFDDSSRFLKDINYWVTFLSANVFRRDAEVISFRMEEYEGSLFAFLAYYLGVLIQKNEHIRLRGPLFARREDNGVGGYKLYKTFTVDLNRLLRAGIDHGLDASAVDVVNAEILTYLLPPFTIRLKSAASNGGRIELGPIGTVIQCCWKYPEMWLVTVPIRLIPGSVGALYWRASAKCCVMFRLLRSM